MKADTLTPFELFGNPARYVVPMFQRPYVWNEQEQWAPLWEDVRTLTERLLEVQPTGPATAGGADVPPHFLGAIVLDQQLGPPQFIVVRNIIDGQQRLTTLQLLLDAAQFVVQEHGEAADASGLEIAIVNNAAIVGSPDERFKVWPTNYDRPAFRAVMDDGSTPDGDLKKAKIAQAHIFFETQVREWCGPDGDPDKVRARLHALTQALLHYLKLVVINLEPGDNAQVIFETLNHRGTPLLAADLVKNLVFQRAEAGGEDVEALYEDLWEPFDSGAWRRNVRQGRLYRPRIDVFLNYWLTMVRRREVPTDRVFSDFREEIRSNDGPTRAIVENLRANAENYDALENKPFDSLEGTFYYRVLKVMEQFALGPLLLWMYGPGAERLSDGQREIALRALESWMVRRMLCRLTAKQTNQLVIDLLEHLDQTDGPAGDTIVAFLAGQTSESRLWPADEAVRAAVLIEPYYKQLTRARLRMVLEAVEDEMRGPKTEMDHCPRGVLTIEHVLPQGWVHHWPPPVGVGDPELLAIERDRTLHTLGNLTLITQPLNSSLSNWPWTDAEARERGLTPPDGKATQLKQHFTLFLNKEILDCWPDAWSESAINARAELLAGGILEIWPAPALP